MAPSALFSALTRYAADQHWQYIYPVWSRRAQGLSIGINLHPNHCCNWHCIYCQVPGLQRGPSPLITVMQLEQELTACLAWLSHTLASDGLTMRSQVQDIAFAGDGEPTTSPQFTELMQLVIHVLQARLPDDRPATVRLITNGSQSHYGHVQHAIQQLNQFEGEVWFKLDAGHDDEMVAVNDSHLPLAIHLQRLRTCTALCRTWVQTAVLSRRIHGRVVTTPTLPSYMQALTPVRENIAGILLYGIARPSQQDHQGCILPTAEALLEQYASVLRTQGFHVRMFV